MMSDETVEEVDNERWDVLLATDAAQALLERLIQEARAEFQAGRTRPMAFTSEGRIIPG